MTSYRQNYTFGKSTLQGGGSSFNLTTISNAERSQLVNIVNKPDFEAESTPNNPLRLVPNANLTFEEQPGSAINFDRIIRDPFKITNPTGDYFNTFLVWNTVNLNNAFGVDPTTQTPFDNRLGVYRLSLQLTVQSNPIGARTAAIVATVTDMTWYMLSVRKTLWAAEMISLPGGNRMLQIDTQYFAYNTLELLREWQAKGLAEPDYYDIRNPGIQLSFTLSQRSGGDLSVEYAHIQFQKVAELDDPDKYKTYKVPDGYVPPPDPYL